MAGLSAVGYNLAVDTNAVPEAPMRTALALLLACGLSGCIMSSTAECDCEIAE